MRVELKEFQETAVNGLLEDLERMSESYYDRGEETWAVCVQAPTGAGKTVISAAAIETILFGDEERGFQPDPSAVVIWLSDSPSLNEQTRKRFIAVSEKIADSNNDTRCVETVTNTFCADHEELEERHIYFLSKDLLGAGKLLVKGSEENGGRVFWDVLNDTIRNRSKHVFLFIDEAHRGLGSEATTLSENKQKTIYANIIDGMDGRAAMPMLIGVTATPERFMNAMAGRRERSLKAPVKITPAQVQASGLLKDTIELYVPSDDDPVEHQYLDMACERLMESDKAWREYCKQEEIPAVNPLLVVQTKDSISDEALEALCDQITHNINGLDGHMSFAHVFGTHQDIKIGNKYSISYTSPEDVQDKQYIRVLFAKEAISNGWDCPRAEVLYSARRRSDATYIAQLIGRMVRTPLARRVDGQEILGSVSCYLPMFDPKATNDVVDYLIGRKDDIGGVGLTPPIVNPVHGEVPKPRLVGESGEQSGGNGKVEPNQTGQQGGFNDRESEIEEPRRKAACEKENDTPVANDSGSFSELEEASGITEDHANNAEQYESLECEERPVFPRDESFTQKELDAIKEAWGKLVSISRPQRQNEQEGSAAFRRLTDVATWLVDADLDKDAPQTCRDAFCMRVEAAIAEYPESFERSKQRAEYAETLVQYLDMKKAAEENSNREEIVTTRDETRKADLFTVMQIAKEANRYYGGNEYLNPYRKYLLSHGYDEYETELRIAGLVGSNSVLQSMRSWAAGRAKEYLEKRHNEVPLLKDELKQRYEALRGHAGLPQARVVEWPSGGQDANGDKRLKRYKKHIVQMEDGLWPIDFKKSNPEDGKRTLEERVLDTEIGKMNTLAFYRNPANRFRRDSLSISYVDYGADRAHKSMYPDFIFFKKDADGNVRPALVDPHGKHLPDAVSKLKGYVKYLREVNDVFVQVYSVSDTEIGDRYIDLLDPATQEAIENMNVNSSAQEIYVGDLSFKYDSALNV